MKVKVLDSFCATEVGMAHAGADIDISQVSEQRLSEWRKRGFIPDEDGVTTPARKGKGKRDADQG